MGHKSLAIEIALRFFKKDMLNMILREIPKESLLEMPFSFSEEMPMMQPGLIPRAKARDSQMGRHLRKGRLH